MASWRRRQAANLLPSQNVWLSLFLIMTNDEKCLRARHCRILADKKHQYKWEHYFLQWLLVFGKRLCGLLRLGEQLLSLRLILLVDWPIAAPEAPLSDCLIAAHGRSFLAVASNPRIDWPGFAMRLCASQTCLELLTIYSAAPASPKFQWDWHIRIKGTCYI